MKYKILLLVSAIFYGLLLHTTNAQGIFNPAVIAGEWNWVSGQELHINADGTSTTWLNGSQINSGRWECTDRDTRHYIFRLAQGGYVDNVDLSHDYNSLSGTNNQGYSIHGTRKVPYSPGFNPTVIAGDWNWVSGQELHIKSDGTSTTWLNGSQINSGRWECTDRNTRHYIFRLAQGGYVDNLDLSQDFNSLSGINNQGSSMHGTRKSGISQLFNQAVIAGNWNWVSGQELRINADGTSTTWLNGRQINSGRWECTDLNTRHYVFRQAEGGYVDNVDLSSDYNKLTGTNSQGYSLSGTRK